MAQLRTPYIALGSPLDEAVAILQGHGPLTQEESGGERSYRVDSVLFSIAIYPTGAIVGSVWYDDPAGRGSESERTEKVNVYLARYGPLQNWELRLDNGWMHYWFNPTDRAQMVYGLHKDIIRFNQYTERNA